MSTRALDPLRLDVATFANDGATLEGRWPLAGFKRVVASIPSEALPTASDEVVWSARGERRTLRGGVTQPWLHLRAGTTLALECQRCLGPVEETLQVERSFLFVADEDVASEVDADTEDDVLVLSRAFNLHELVEDELLLAMPLVPRHAVCPVPLAVPLAETEEPADERPNPFAALATLKRGGSVN